MSNAACAATDTYDYDAFGNKVNSTGTTPNNYMYRGEQYDPDLGLYYLRARYYNPLTGRFMSRDPEDPGPSDADGVPTDPKYLHKYLYANGDPVNRLDRSGRAALMEVGFMLVDTIEETVGPELLAEEEDHILMCVAFDLLMKNKHLADVDPPWWYCELGSF